MAHKLRHRRIHVSVLNMDYVPAGLEDRDVGTDQLGYEEDDFDYIEDSMQYIFRERDDMEDVLDALDMGVLNAYDYQ